MRIDRLTVQNFRCFDHRAWDFTPGFNVLIGNNGTGKTAILDALKIALGGYLAGLSGVKFEKIRPDDIRLIAGGTTEQPTLEPVRPVVVEAMGEVGGKSIQWSRRLESGLSNGGKTVSLRNIASGLEAKVQNKEEVVLPVMAYYPSGRLWQQHTEKVPSYIILTNGPEAKRKVEEDIRNGNRPLPVIHRPGSRFAAYRACLNAQSNEKEVREWFTRLSLGELQEWKPNATLDAVRLAAATALPEWDKFYYDVKINELVVRRSNGDLLPTRLLSDGQRNTVSMVADLAYRCALLNPHLRDRAAAETPGCVLIDEIDLHLHPNWQRHIVDDLRKVFPKVQFFAATHSPLIIQSLKAGELIDLGPQVDQEPEKYIGKSPEDILEEVQNVPMPQRSLRSQQMIAVAEQYYALLQEAPKHPDLTGLRRELDRLMEPYEENEAFVAALRLERRAAGIDNGTSSNGDGH